MRSATARADRQSSCLSASEPHGYVHVAGQFATAHRREIEARLQHEARRARGDSPGSRIIATDVDSGGGLLVATTTEHLAHRLGQALFKTFGGELHHGFGHGNRLAFVWWRC